MGRSDREAAAAESETQGLRVWSQVPALWLYVVSCFTILSVVLALVSIVLGAHAIKNANDNKDMLERLERSSAEPALMPEQQVNDSEPSVQLQTSTKTEPTEGSIRAMASEMTAVSRATPGRNFSDNKGQDNPFNEHVFTIVVHGLDLDTFWHNFEQGVADAARFFRVHFNYDNPENDDEHLNFNEMIADITKARYNLQDGLAVSIPDDEALNEAIRIAAEAIPVLSVNSGDKLLEKLGLFTHIGQPEAEAGRRAGIRMKEIGVSRAICLKHEDTNIMAERCQGFEEGLGPDAVVHTLLAGKGIKPEDISMIVGEALSDDPDVGGILTLGPSGFKPARALLARQNRVCSPGNKPANSDCLEFGTFDLSSEILEAIAAGEVNFGIDQQEYLQGYLSVAFLQLKAIFGVSPGAGEIVLSGPKFVDNPEDATALLLRNYTAGKTLNGKEARDLDIRFIAHGKPEDSFWKMVKSGVKFTSNRYGITIDYREPPSEASPEQTLEFMTDRVKKAVVDGVDGIVISIPSDDTGLSMAIQDAVTNDIPIIAVNAGIDLFEPYNISVFVGQSNILAGRGAGKRLAEAGVRHAVCVIHDNPNQDLEERCDGLLDGLQEIEPDAQMLRLNGTTVPGTSLPELFSEGMEGLPSILEEAVLDAINTTATIDAVVALGPTATQPVVAAIGKLKEHCSDGRTPNRTRDCIAVATFDVSAPTMDFIEEEKVLFAVNEMAIMQGGLPIMFLTLQNLWGNMPVGVVSTGPGFVDVENVGKVKVFAV